MARGTPATGQRRRYWKPILLGCFTVPLLACGIGFFVLSKQISNIGSQAPAEVTKLRAMGVQTEPADLNPDVPVDDAKNAAPIYQSLAYQLEALQDDPTKKDLVKLLDTFSVSQNATGELPRVLQALQTHQPLFLEADKLGAKSGYDLKRDYTKGFALLFPEFASMKRLAKWQCSRARAQWMSADRDGALKTLRNAYQIGNHLDTDEFLIGHLVYLATQAICHRTLEGFLTDARNDPAMLGKFKALLAGIPAQGNLRRSLGGEVVLGRVGIRTIRGVNSLSSMANTGGAPANNGMEWLDRLLMNASVQRMYEAKYLEAWRKAFERMPKDQEDWTGLKAAMEETTAKIDRDRSFENILNRILFPVFGDAVDASANQVAERRLAKLSIELLLMRQKGLPKDLSSFGKLAIDPFTGKSMLYKREGRAFKIWSVGPDRVDQGGVARKPGSGSGNEGIDLVMGYDMPIPQAQPNDSPNR